MVIALDNGLVGNRLLAVRIRQHLHLGDGDDKPSAPFTDVPHLLDHLFLEIPAEDQDVVRFCVADPLGSEDRNAGSRKEVSLLVRTPVDGVVDEVRTDAALVEQRVALARCTVSDDLLSVAFRGDQELEQ